MSRIPRTRTLIRPSSAPDEWDERQPDPSLSAAGLRMIGSMVRDGRHRVGITQSALERMSGVDQTTISRLERGLRPGLRLSRLAAILAALERAARWHG